MLEIDGSDGGGQLLRTALSLAALENRSIQMTNIRGARSNPGLRPQHYTVVQLLADICAADVADVSVGDEELTFEPDGLRGGTYAVDVGTAGSLTLLFDAVLPLALTLDGSLSVVATGGTDVKWSPTMAHYRKVKLPLLRRAGLHAIVTVDRPGFYPAGGGEATLRLAHSSLDPIEIGDRGSLQGVRIYSLASSDLSEQSVARRQANAATEKLETAGLEPLERTVRQAKADSPGSAVCLRLDYESTIAGFDALGEPGKPAESVAADAVEAATGFHDGFGTVDQHTADQLLVFLARSGGRLLVDEVTDHVATNVELLERFGYDASISAEGRGSVLTFAMP